ncbi:unnamed protein product [Meganyctiphanes norvegica]|uniref:Uncharacterized protein n=1 Tax=Meganyctiphanes norvegica TaxID=48144 RepID=A0AAV2SEZ8_MEGNR
MRPHHIIALALIHTATATYNCYWCKNYESSSATPFDSNCGNDGYSGNKGEESWNEQCCYTKIYDDGSVMRSGCQGESNGECKEGNDGKGHYNECYCVGDSCNNDQCPDCGGPAPPTGPGVSTTTKAPGPGGDHTCYACQNYDQASSIPFDANCGNDGFSGNTVSVDGDDNCCYTIVYENGNTMRTGCTGHGDGECREGNGWTGCYCSGDNCNSHTCQGCNGGVTTDGPTDPGHTTPTTTQGPTDPGHTTPTTTQGPTDPGHTTPTTTHGPSLGLSCYSCMDCPNTDDSTNTISDPAFNSCFTILVSGSHVVYRGGSPDHHSDGDCSMVDGNMTCYCTHDNCNGTDAL